MNCYFQGDMYKGSNDTILSVKLRFDFETDLKKSDRYP